MIFRARAPRMVSRLGRLRQLSNGFGVFPRASVPARHGPSACKTARAREYAATSPLSRVIAAAFPLASKYDTASSPARDHTCVCVCFILCDRLPYTAYVESPALAWRLYQVPIVSRVVSNCRRHLASEGLPVHRDRLDCCRPVYIAPEYRVRPPAIDGRKLAVTPVAPASAYLSNCGNK